LNFFLFTVTDASARFFPVLIGSLLVVVPYSLRNILGRTGALVTAVLLAFSPSFLFFSRSLAPDIVVAAATLVALAGVVNFVETRRPLAIYAAFGALGVAFAAGPTVYTIVIIAASFVALVALWNRLRRPIDLSGLDSAFSTLNSVLARALAVGAGTFIGVCTAALINLSGLQAGVDLFAAWLAPFIGSGGPSWRFYALLLVVYEPLVLLWGLIGAVYFLAIRKSSDEVAAPLQIKLFAVFLVWWAIVALVVYSLAGQKPPSLVLMPLLPLVLLAGMAIGRWLEGLDWREVRTTHASPLLLEGVSLVFVSAIAVYGAIQVSGFAVTGDTTFVAVLLITLILLVVSFAALWFLLGIDRVVRIAAALSLVVLGVLTVHAAWSASYFHAGDAREMLGGPVVTSPDVRELVRSLEGFSGRREGDEHVMAVAVRQNSPILGWYLRDFVKVRFVDTNEAVSEPAVIGPAGKENSPGPNYAGERFRFQTTWSARDLTVPEMLRWFLYRQSIVPEQSRDLMLWIANP
jgi:uncharacterized protein (TIGR03663 family)